MKRFRFRLASLENIRRMQVDELRQVLAKQQAALRKAEDELLSQRAALDDTYNGIAQERTNNPDTAVLASFEAYAGMLRKGMQMQAYRVLELRRELDLAQRRLIEKYREQKVLGKLRERQHAQHSLKLERDTQHELDEAARYAHPPEFSSHDS
jgi:flagellar FliJ protein